MLGVPGAVGDQADDEQIDGSLDDPKLMEAADLSQRQRQAAGVLPAAVRKVKQRTLLAQQLRQERQATPTGTTSRRQRCAVHDLVADKRRQEIVQRRQDDASGLSGFAG